LVEPMTPMRGRFGMMFLPRSARRYLCERRDDRQSSQPRQAVSSAD
jgi:hypothetical protein